MINTFALYDLAEGLRRFTEAEQARELSKERFSAAFGEDVQAEPIEFELSEGRDEMSFSSNGGNIRGMKDSLAMREFIAEQREKVYELRRKIATASQDVRDHMQTQAEYDAWWQTTPDDDPGFYRACLDKLAELANSKAAERADGLNSCNQNTATEV